MIGCTLGPLAQCTVRELIRVKVGNGTEWAIVGAQDPGLFPLVLLTGKSAPFVVNVPPNDPGDFETYPVAKYGLDYRFAHDPNGPSEIGDGPLSKTAGSLVLTEAGDWHLIVNQYRQATVRWFELGSGKIVGDRGIRRIAFSNWDLCFEGLRIEPSETILLSHGS
jgi:hypothetical protein